MTPEHFRAVRALYEAVVELPAEARAAHLHTLSSEPLLLSDVLALFDAGAAAPNGWITRPVRGALAELSKPAPGVGAVIGVWRISAEIGEGGMGSVFLVERCDGHFEQIAALKLLKGLPSAERLAYFSRERQLLAKLTHTNIARLYDGGITSNGQPYLVMEYVEGLHVDQHCQSARLSRDGVLKLFIEACHGVAFAHRQLIVHCDIKPSNLLINKDGRPVLLDFGIARLSDAEASELGTILPAQAFTPRYASPEQQAGEAISTLSDIYSLGLLLAELLDLAQGRDRELAAIIAKASHAEQNQRYPSVDALIDDLHRYRQRLPLRAMPATRTYVARKFLARRWPLVLSALAFAATVAAFTVQVVFERDVATAQRDRATQAEASAQRINAFLGSVLSSVDPDNARSMDRSLMQSVLNQAAARALTELRDRPRELREISTVIADSYFSISDFAQAEHHYQIAQSNFVDVDPNDLSITAARLQLLHKYAKSLMASDKLDAAKAVLNRGLADARRHLGDRHEITLSLRTLQAEQLFRAGLPKQSLALAEDNYLQMQRAQISDPDIWFDQLVLMAKMNSNSGNFERARPILQQAITLASERYGASSSRTLRARNNLAVLLLQSKRYTDAVMLLRPLARDAERYLGENNYLTISLLSNLGTALRYSGENIESGEYYVKAYQRSVAAFGVSYDLSLQLANNLAIYELNNGQAKRALQRINDVVRIVEPQHERLDPFLIESLRTHALALVANRQIELARAAWHDVIERDLALYGAMDAQTLSDQAALETLGKP